MLGSWTLGGFRSIGRLTCLELGGLNVLIGANSAGKSSLLHSILMAAQTLGNPLVDRPLSLNGPLLRLGLPADVLHEGSAGIALGFELRPDTTTMPAATRLRQPDFSFLRIAAEFRSVSSELLFENVDAVVQPLDVDETVGVNVAARSKRDLGIAFRNGGLRAKESQRLASRLDAYAITGAVTDRVVGARLRQFLPDDVLQVVNRHEAELDRLRWAYGYGVTEATPASRARRTAVSRPVLDFMARFLDDEFGQEAAARIPRRGEITVDELARRVDGRHWQQIQNLVATAWFADHRDELKFDGYLSSERLPEPLASAVDYARSWFQSSVRHLGPLRAAPQPLYGLPEAASGTSVGRDGEYTAAVLSAHARRLVWCPDPRGGDASRVALEEAVNLWMTELGLLSSVSSQERGKLGFELRLSVEGVKRDLDLTTVGVGVSQALPIVTLGLLVDPGALLLFEQPELHLHPDVQAALGDFFVALAASGRQLIVETHSEYLVTRLRLLAATSSSTVVPDLVRLFFFERRAGESAISQARVKEGGGIPEWPKGFLDTAARELHALAIAGRTVT